MKKVKVIFPDGSIAEVEEADLQGALAAGAKRYSGVKKEFMAFPDGSTAEINESDINGAIKAGAVKKKDQLAAVLPDGSPSGASQFGTRDLMGKPLSLQGAPEPEVSTVFDYWNEEIKSGDKVRIDKARNDIVRFNSNRNPVVLTASDKDDIVRITGGATDPQTQLDILNQIQVSASSGNRFSSTDVVGGRTQGGGRNLPTTQVDAEPTLPPDDLNKAAVYVDKLRYKLGKKVDTTWSNKSQLTIGGKETTGLEELMNLLNPVGMSPVAAIQEAQRFNSEKLTDSFSTGIESIKETDGKEYERVTNIIKSGRPLPTTDVIRYTSLGSKIIADKTAQGVVDGDIDADQFATINENISKDLDNNVYKHPDFLRSLMSDVISKHYEKDGGVVFSKWMVTDKEIDAVPQERFVAAGLDPNNPEFKKQLSFLKEKEGWMPFQNAIAKDDLFREFKKGFASVPAGIASTAESLVTDDDVLMADEATRQFNVSETANRRGEYFEKNYGVLADAFQGLGQFSAQLATMYGGSTAIGAAGEALGGGTTASFLMNATRLQRLGNTLKSGKDLYATYGVPFVMSYGDYYKDALSQGANPLQAKMMAFTNASVEGLSETIFDNLAFGRQVAKNLTSKENYNKIAKIFDKGVLDEASTQAYKENLQEVIKNTAKTFGSAALGATKESFEEVPVALTNFIVDAAANPDNVEGRNVVGEMKDAFLDGLVSFSIPSLLGLGGNLNQQFKKDKTAHESLMVAAMERPFVEEAINNLVAKGELPQEQANKKLQILNTAARQLQNIPANYTDGEEISPLDREKYLSLSVKEKYLEEQIKTGDGAVKKIAGQQVEEITKLKESILNKTPVVEEAQEPDSLSEVKSAINNLPEGIYTDVLKEAAKEESPERLTIMLKEVAQQMNSSENEAVNTRKVFGEVADMAQKLYPDQKVGDATKEVSQELPRGEETNAEDVITIGEMIGKSVMYKGQRGQFMQDGQAVVFKVEGQNREYELGNIEEIKDQSIKDYDIEQEESVVSNNEAGDIVVRGAVYKNNYSNPIAAINRDNEGNIISVNLETEDGQKRTFRGDVAEDIAYQIHLKEITNDNETTQQFEDFINQDEGVISEIAGLSEVAQEATVGDNATVSREKIEAKPRIRITAEQQLATRNTETTSVGQESQPASEEVAFAEEATLAESGKALAKRIRQLKSKRDILQTNIFGIPIAIYDGLVETVATAVEQGTALAEAIQAAINSITDKNFDKEGFQKSIEDFAAGNKPIIKVQLGDEKRKGSAKATVKQIEENLINGIGENADDALLDSVIHRRDVGADISVEDTAKQDKLKLELTQEDADAFIQDMKELYGKQYLAKTLSAINGLNKNRVSLDKILAVGIALENEINNIKDGFTENEFNISRPQLNKVYAQIQKINVANARISSKALNTAKTLYNSYENVVAKESILTKEQAAEKEAIMEVVLNDEKLAEAADEHEKGVTLTEEAKQEVEKKDERPAKKITEKNKVKANIKDILTDLKDKLNKLDC